MSHRYKVREIAQQAGLSEATVDRVLSPETSVVAVFDGPNGSRWLGPTQQPVGRTSPTSPNNQHSSSRVLALAADGHRTD